MKTYEYDFVSIEDTYVVTYSGSAVVEPSVINVADSYPMQCKAKLFFDEYIVNFNFAFLVKRLNSQF